jgi:hypothetical protein
VAERGAPLGRRVEVKVVAGAGDLDDACPLCHRGRVLGADDAVITSLTSLSSPAAGLASTITSASTSSA